MGLARVLLGLVSMPLLANLTFWLRPQLGNSMEIATWHDPIQLRHKAGAGRGQFTVKATALYADDAQPGAFDDRSRAEIDLEKVETAIRTLATGGMVQEYTIATIKVQNE